MDDEQINEELARKRINPYYFTDGSLQVGFDINLDSVHINHAKSKLTNKPKCSEIGIEIRFVFERSEEMVFIYARLKNQYKFKNQTVFQRFDEQDEDGQMLDETKFYLNLNINHNRTLRDNKNSDSESSLDRQTQKQEMKNSGLRFDKNKSMTI